MIAPRTSCAAGPTAWGKDTFARATHSAFKGLYARYFCSRAHLPQGQARATTIGYLAYHLKVDFVCKIPLLARATIWYLVYKGRPSAARDDRVLYLTYNLDNALKLVT